MPPIEYENEDAVVSESKEKLKKPPLYKVLIHNDDFTTMEFVVFAIPGLLPSSSLMASAF